MIFQNFFSRWNDFLEGEIIDLGGMFTSELKGVEWMFTWA